MMNVLVVDDSATMRSIITRVMRMTGIQAENIIQAVNGREGLAAMKSNHIDLVMADINMPEMDGLEMIEAMKSEESTSGIPVVVISTEGSDARIFKLRRMGVRAFLRKPFTAEILSKTINSVMGDGPAPGGSFITADHRFLSQ